MDEDIDRHIFVGDGGWYFWDEIGYNKFGPYSSKEEAKRMCIEYSKELNRIYP